MCQNVFKNEEEKKRKEDFTKLFVSIVSNSQKEKICSVNIKKQAL